jgi:regulator of protease activity HflC (stomatin/prohibitin superfamily)
VFDKLVDTILGALELFQFWVVIHQYERGVVMTLGKFKGRELGPGIHWRWPFKVDVVQYDTAVTRVHVLNPQALTTKDGKTVAVTAVITSNIRDIKKAMLEVDGVHNAIDDACCAAVGAHVGNTTWEDLREDLAADTLLKACRKNAWRYGIEIERVQLSDLALCRVIRLHANHGGDTSSLPFTH